MTDRIYLDNNSTTQLDPLAFEAMLFDLKQIPRNPSSIHSFGQDARNELTRARRAIAHVLKVSPDELLFSSGATESNNYLLKGFFKKIFPKKIITTKLEHSSLFKLIEQYEKEGGEVHYLPVNEKGCPSLTDIQEALTNDCSLIVLMAVNNETGVKTNYQEIAKLAFENQVPYIVDAVALLGKEPFEIVQGITAATFSGHKLHAPKGVGLTYFATGHEIAPLIEGGNQENGKRAGTQNLSGILGFSKVIERLPYLLPAKTNEMQNLRDYFEKTLLDQLPDVVINGTSERICNTSNLAFLGLDGESLLMNLDLNKVAASHGSACSSGSLAPSRILLQMGYSKKRVESSIRFSVSRMTTQKEIEKALSIIIDVVKKMRAT